MTLRIFFSGLAILLGTVLAFMLEGIYDSFLAHAVLLMAAIVAVMVLLVALRPDKRISLLCDPVALLCLFTAQFYVIGSLAQVTLGPIQMAFFRPPGPRYTIAALIACLLMLIGVLIGYRLHLGTVLARELPAFAPGPRKLPGRLAETGIVVLSLGGCLSWIQWQGGLLSKLNTSYGESFNKGGAIYTLACNGLVAGTLLMAWRLFASPVKRRWETFLFIGVLLFDAVFFGVLFGVRKYLLFIFFGLLTVWVLRRGAATLPKFRMGILLAVLLVFFSVWGSVRGIPLAALMGQSDSTRYAQAQSYHQGYLQGVAEPFTIASLVLQIFPEEEEFRHGSTMLVTLLGFIPRAVWPGKPIGIGKELTRYVAGPFYEPIYGASVAPTLPADLYLNFNWLGVFLGGLVIGLLCRMCVSYAVDGMENGVQTRAARVLLPALFISGLGEVRGDMSTVLSYYAMTFIPTLVALSFFRIDVEPVPLARA